jgi:ABC-type antimicrobial peptide transport system permease subunit
MPGRLWRRFTAGHLGASLLGVIIGLAGAVELMRVLGSLLYGVGPHDPLVLGAVAAVLLVTGVLACTVPALRASRVAPVEALRHD